ncbi:hypothetical protein [Synechococcus sp. PCC 6312]|uniref:hypothetical protein n=1 Tax=Synechococcus sp. (strain ATCC 27167 / PCC 6312) TaxID=195253 RepID=UPI0002DD5054|nr:hypothetical protein [Synechococcus sp. PCC 6312]
MKQTKTGEVNWLPLMPTIRAALEKQYKEPFAKAKFWGQELEHPKPSALVFPGHQGGALDIRRFSITWKAVLTGLTIPHRYPDRQKDEFNSLNVLLSSSLKLS